jgi:hypothetical protein
MDRPSMVIGRSVVVVWMIKREVYSRGIGHLGQSPNCYDSKLTGRRSLAPKYMTEMGIYPSKII